MIQAPDKLTWDHAEEVRALEAEIDALERVRDDMVDTLRRAEFSLAWHVELSGNGTASDDDTLDRVRWAIFGATGDSPRSAGPRRMPRARYLLELLADAVRYVADRGETDQEAADLAAEIYTAIAVADGEA